MSDRLMDGRIVDCCDSHADRPNRAEYALEVDVSPFGWAGTARATTRVAVTAAAGLISGLVLWLFTPWQLAVLSGWDVAERWCFSPRSGRR